MAIKIDWKLKLLQLLYSFARVDDGVWYMNDWRRNGVTQGELEIIRMALDEYEKETHQGTETVKETIARLEKDKRDSELFVAWSAMLQHGSDVEKDFASKAMTEWFIRDQEEAYGNRQSILP